MQQGNQHKTGTRTIEIPNAITRDYQISGTGTYRNIASERFLNATFFGK